MLNLSYRLGMRRIIWIPLLVWATSCGEEEAQCIQTYDRCPGGNPCEPICVFEDEAPLCEDTNCPQPNEPEGTCQLFTNECVFR